MPGDFIRDIIEADLRTGKHGGRVLTRFPPEPNGYLHIGHAKSICLNFGIAQQYGTRCNLRFDDTNPLNEDTEYVESIQRDIHWLGFDFGALALYASDYFDEMYALAEGLVLAGKAYVDHLSDEEIRDYRGSLSEPGRPSPYREREVDENLALLRQMRDGDLADGTCVLRARIDLASPNMKMRDPLLYRIRHATHDRTGDAWPIYPMYDFAHPISDAIEGITHSICTLEFENNRELYDWVVANTGVSERHGFASRPQQIEFARLNLDHTIMSKRKLLQLVEGGHVAGWDDPRMPTIAGMRRRGYRPEAIRAFAELIGVAKVNSTVDIGKLEFCVRDDLNWIAPRVLGVLRPLRVTVTSWPAGETEWITGAPHFPPDVGKPGSRDLPFSGDLRIDRDDFALEPPAGWQRLAPGRTVRLRHGYCVTFEDAVVEDGEVVEVKVRHIPDSVGSNPAGVKVSGVIGWVSAPHAVPAEVRLYDRLFTVARPDLAEGEVADYLNPSSLEVVRDALVEPSLRDAEPGTRWQLERVGYFVVDEVDSKPGALVLNRIVGLRDSSAAPVEDVGVAATGKSSKTRTRPPKRSRAEYRAEARQRDPVLAERFASWPAEHGLPVDEADLLTGERSAGDLFLATVAAGAPAGAAARWIVNEVPDEPGALTGAGLAALIGAVADGAVSGSSAKDVLAEMVGTGGDPASIIAARGLSQVSDEAALAALVDEVLAASPDEVARYRDGNRAVIGYFVGQVVRGSAGRANPRVVKDLLAARLD